MHIKKKRLTPFIFFLLKLSQVIFKTVSASLSAPKNVLIEPR